ncbi:hypothetical protein OIO90_004094 [Microbotryomycetes sp. JL221]|nr:hypothetical protein OIO90_004094 [Microbotryomycetes sp. JL221]
MMRLTLASIALAATAAHASVISTSVFPNSACAGAGAALGGLVGIGRVTLSNGEVETHCGCPSDNLPSFETCPSSDNGESVCNSVLDLETGAFTASCGIISCQGSECPSTVVNTVVVDETDCAGKGQIGISSVDGEDKCACSADAGEFVACPSVDNGRATCVAVDNDFLGMAYTHKEVVKCGVACSEGFALSPAGVCVKIEKRAFHPMQRRMNWGSSSFHGSKTRSHTPPHGTPTSPGHETPTTPPGGHGTTTPPGGHGTTTPPGGHGTTTPPGGHDTTSTTTTPTHFGTSKPHGPSFSHRPTPTTDYTFTHNFPTPGPSQRAKRQVGEEIVFGADTCTQDERACPAGDFGDFSCVRLDDVTQCGGCHSSGDAVSCLDIPGVASAACLRGGCVVRACQSGFVQTSDNTCSPRA